MSRTTRVSLFLPSTASGDANTNFTKQVHIHPSPERLRVASDHLASPAASDDETTERLHPSGQFNQRLEPLFRDRSTRQERTSP